MSSFSIEVGEKATIIFAETGSAEKCRFVRNGSLWRTLAALPFAARRSPLAARRLARHSRGGREMHGRDAARRNAMQCNAMQCETARHDGRVTMRRERRDAATVSPRVSYALRLSRFPC
ncbi:hypothetical protein [Burkholderia thailandensis]|uniref:hypothetical protein n=1 Tax=Burkholderia thailandensis TaxID=57975 RepID=UPI00217CF391|nr:hypothetical protein [Burkholderia thailandensis]MCS6423707.1 hypothetical protein [Burkholderia thailandensis]MCS6463264.1 hypothetical protein [Burkholderia thailandensis]